MPSVEDAVGEILVRIYDFSGFRTRRELAKKIGISPGYLSQLMSGKAHMSVRTKDQLIAAFPAFARDIEQAVINQASLTLSGEAVRLDRIQTLVDTARFSEAVDGVQTLLAEGALRARQRVEANWLLAKGLLELGNIEEACAAARAAVEVQGSFQSDLRETEVDSFCIRLTRLERHSESLNVAEAAIGCDFQNPNLWRRLGCIQWYDGNLVGAFASLSTSLSLGAKRSRILHARGQVLVEMGEAGMARVDLEEVLESPPSPISEAYARAALGRALAILGDKDGSQKEFQRSLKLVSGNAWLHFHMGESLLESGDLPGARASFERSLEATSPTLNRFKLEHATMRLGELADK